jgi:hypothetical protein
MAETYRRNGELRHQWVTLTNQLLDLRERTFRKSEITQRALVNAQTRECDPTTVADQYQQALEENKQAVAQRESLSAELARFEVRRREVLFNNFTELRRLACDYRDKTAVCLRYQLQQHTNALVTLRRRSDNAVADLRVRAAADTREALGKRSLLLERQKTLREAYDSAVQSGARAFTVNGRTIAVHDAPELLGTLEREGADVLQRIRRTSLAEMDEETAIAEQEIRGIEDACGALSRWIAGMENLAAESQAELQSLKVRSGMVAQKRTNPQYDTSKHFEAAVAKLRRGNGHLVDLITQVTQEIEGFDAALGNAKAGLTLEERMASIVEKKAERRRKQDHDIC